MRKYFPDFMLCIALAPVILLLAGCSSLYLPYVAGPIDTGAPMPANPAYVLALNVSVGENMKENELVIVDPGAWQVVRRVPLPGGGGGPWSIARDPRGRIWIGYAVLPGQVDNRVVVFQPDGTLVAVLHPCTDPASGFAFTPSRAFVPCAMNGFYAALAIVDMDSLQTIQTLEIHLPGHDSFMLIGSGGDQNTIVMHGGTDKAGLSVLVDTQTLSITTVSAPSGNVPTIIPYQGKFYMLDVAGQLNPQLYKSLYILDPTPPPSIVERDLAALGPSEGFIQQNQLYAYHNPYRHVAVDPEFKGVSRLDLDTGETRWWPLPPNWIGEGIAWIDGQIVLSGYLYGEPPSSSGLYALDTKSGKLTQLMAIPGARKLPPSMP